MIPKSYPKKKGQNVSGDGWMYPDPNVGPLWEIPIYALYIGYLWVINP